jgi:hypothetical protein
VKVSDWQECEGRDLVPGDDGDEAVGVSRVWRVGSIVGAQNTFCDWMKWAAVVAMRASCWGRKLIGSSRLDSTRQRL